MQAGNAAQVITRFDGVGVKGFGLFDAQLQFLAGINSVGSESVQFFDIRYGQSIRLGYFPQCIPTFNDMDVLGRCFKAQFLSDHDFAVFNPVDIH